MKIKLATVALGLVAAVSANAAVCNAPITPNATDAAKKLYSFIANNYGTKTISGVMTGNMDGASDKVKEHEDVVAVYTAGGKYPALVGFDFLFATGKDSKGSWQRSYTNKTLALAEDLWNQGGIPAFTWHWKDPSDSVEAFYASQNAAGYEDKEKTKPKPYTTFNFTKAFMPGTTTWDTLSTTYKQIVSDIDEIADIFLGLQEKGVAAVFRPLHELGGTWFWWSTQSGASFAALYKLVYERMVFKKGVHNLVWVWNPERSVFSTTSWNPGGSYYDVASVDIYNSANDHQSNASAFSSMTTQFPGKILALSENGPIPDVTNMHNDNAVWSWWMPWYESWSSGFVSQTANSVWQQNLSSDKIITLDKMPGWASYSATVSGEACAVATETSKYDGNPNGAVETPNSQMKVTYKTLDKNGANIEFTTVPDLTGATTASVKITNNGTSPDEGVWIGLAFVRNGMADDGWTWEMSPSDGCWITTGATATCDFDITQYKDDDGVSHPTDLNNLFSVTLMVATVGFSGSVTFDNLVTDNGKVISSFDTDAELFKVAEQSKAVVTSIERVDDSGKPQAIQVRKTIRGQSSLTLQGNSLSFTTARSGNVSLDVFDLQGNRVASLYKGALSAGTHQFSLSGMARGSYLVRAKGAGLSATKRIVIK